MMISKLSWMILSILSSLSTTLFQMANVLALNDFLISDISFNEHLIHFSSEYISWWNKFQLSNHILFINSPSSYYSLVSKIYEKQLKIQTIFYKNLFYQQLFIINLISKNKIFIYFLCKNMLITSNTIKFIIIILIIKFKIN